MQNKKPHILFVDDEMNILNGLRRGLRSRRSDWDMSFANGAMDAINQVDETDFDIVVSDMRMPGINGAALLDYVRKNSPITARIILSGFSEEEAILKTIGAAHQFLAKPCDFNELQSTLDQIISLREEFDKDHLQALVGSKQNLPSLPDRYSALCKELEKPTSNSSSIAQIIIGDLGLETQILKVCNSAFFGLPQKVPDLATAISLLGVETIKSMVLMQGLFEGFEGSPQLKNMVKRLCDNSCRVGELAGFFAQNAGLSTEDINLAKSAGMLSHVGTLILATGWPDMFINACKLAEQEQVGISEFEQELFHTDHGLIGSYFLGLWGFPLTLFEAVAYHHEPQKANHAKAPILAAVHLAQAISALENAKADYAGNHKNKMDRTFLFSNSMPCDLQSTAAVFADFMRKDFLK